MPYTDFGDEVTTADMARAWQVEYKVMQRIIRLCEEIPTRQQHNKMYFDREAQVRLAAATEMYIKHPRMLFRAERLHRAKVAHEKMSREIRLQDHIEKNLEEITALRAERADLLTAIDQLRAHSTPGDDDDGLLLRLIHVASLDEYGYAALAHAALDTNADAALVLDGALKVLGVTLDAGLRKADNRLLTKAQTMTIYTALSTLVRLGQMADTRLTQYAGVADALAARHQATDTRTPQEVTP